jgi:hypothetical protein
VSSIDAWTEAVGRMLERDGQPQAIYDCLRLSEPAFVGSLSAVKRLVQRLRGTQAIRPEDVAIPVRSAPGEIAQVDFGYVGQLYDGGAGRIAGTSYAEPFTSPLRTGNRTAPQLRPGSN